MKTFQEELDSFKKENYPQALQETNLSIDQLLAKEEVQKYFKQFNKSKAILIDFGNYNVKYIYAGLFSKKQIKRIFNLLRVNK